ncbi:hypothetical protein [Bradyrhizobium septentrionale]|uniref:Uncharacterized protein n=1 Tax=Bradyrhizobium septentrionale TaxID=1404411 RepID=A0A973W3A9_9BRAD|nr:hypothetical protein [Bradyrhizobium septentrionale]UGY15576.1 hypothetical protein HAP48_0044880 [Bradyrhizobium septentrionale]
MDKSARAAFGGPPGPLINPAGVIPGFEPIELPGLPGHNHDAIDKLSKARGQFTGYLAVGTGNAF